MHCSFFIFSWESLAQSLHSSEFLRIYFDFSELIGMIFAFGPVFEIF